MRKKYLACFFMTVVLSTTYGQVDDIKEDAREDKENREQNDNSENGGSTIHGNSYHEGDDDDDGFFSGFLASLVWQLFYGMFDAVQSAALDQKPVYPYVSSLESKMWVGYSPQKSALYLSPELEGNWGIFSTDFRYVYLHDRTGTLQNIDWQVLKLNVPVKTFKASFGLGFTRLLNPRISYFEYATGFDLRLMQDRMVVSGEYRNCPRGNENGNFRQEVNVQVDYKTARFGRFHLSPMLGLRYQNYYTNNKFWIVNAGVTLRFY